MPSSGQGLLPAGPPARLRAPSWRDPRLLIGLLLLLSSVAVGARVVALADRTEPFYAAASTLPTGTPLSATALEVVRLRLTGTSAGYLDARRPLPTARVLSRTVGRGELIPLSALESGDQLGSRPVSIPLDGRPPAGLAVGGLVDVWASAKQTDSTGGGYGRPARIAHEVAVFHVEAPGTGLSATQNSSIQIMVPPDTLPQVLDALANEARLAVLPVPGSAP